MGEGGKNQHRTSYQSPSIQFTLTIYSHYDLDGSAFMSSQMRVRRYRVSRHTLSCSSKGSIWSWILAGG